MVAGSAGWADDAWAAAEVTQAVHSDRPVLRDDKKVGVERQLTQAESWLMGRGAASVVFGEDDIQVAAAQFGHGSEGAALGLGRIAGWVPASVRRPGRSAGS